MSSVSRMSRAGLTDDAFEAFKQDVAARVIQAHWRRWQAWKSQVGGGVGRADAGYVAPHAALVDMR
jgi:hypothetical protein